MQNAVGTNIWKMMCAVWRIAQEMKPHTSLSRVYLAVHCWCY